MKKKPLVQVNHASKRYELDGITIHALKNVSATISKGEFVAILGPSGSGKSTLMNLIGALDTPTDGEILIDGENIAHMSESQLARVRNQKVGFIFQQFMLLAKTPAWQNVEVPLLYAGIGSHEREQRSKKILKQVGLGDKLNNFSNQLSGGQQQRVAIARALVNNPTILLADEPTGALDQKTGKDILKIFKDLNQKGHTIIMVTHDHEIAKNANRTIKIVDGEIV